MTNHEFLSFAGALFGLWLATQAGTFVRRKRGQLDADDITDLGIVVTASLTLLGLIIGFTFSMAMTRYNQRKDCEAAEANAIRTEYLRASLLPPEEGAKVREVLKNYVERRVQFYLVDERSELEEIEAGGARMSADLWDLLQPRAAAQQTAIIAMAVSGVNDIWNSEGLTNAAWFNRIPIAGWLLMACVATCCHFLVGFTARRNGVKRKRFWVLPTLVSLSFLLIADIDNPRKGAIVVHPRNLERLSASLRGHGLADQPSWAPEARRK